MRELPPYTHTPGVTVHPNNEGGHYSENGEDLGHYRDLLDESRPDKNEVYMFAIELFNKGYYWETHVYLEHLWNLHNRKGKIADFLKAMIKLCACGVKLRVGEVKLASDHLRSFQTAIDALAINHYCGIDFKQILSFSIPDHVEKLNSGTPKVFWEEIKIRPSH